MPPPRHVRPTRRAYNLLWLALLLALGGVVLWRATAETGSNRPEAAAAASPTNGGHHPGSPPSRPTPSSRPTPAGRPSTTPKPVITPGPVNTRIPGLTTFRGNWTRDYYGEGPVPMHP